jgi:hypothetical protein
VAPDGVAALRAAAGLLAFAGVHETEVVDVSVRLCKVAIRIAVIAIGLVGRREIEVAVIRRSGQRLLKRPEDGSR